MKEHFCRVLFSFGEYILNTKILFPIIPVLFTVSCGGSSTGGIQYGTTATSGFNEIADLSEAYIDRFGGTNPDRRQTTAAEMPTMGSASFTGYVTVGSSRLSPSIIGYQHAAKTTADVDFATGEITGEAGQFYDVTDRDLSFSSDTYGGRRSGSLSYSLTTFGPSPNDFLGTATGEITTQDGNLVPVNVTVGGILVGPEADGLRVATLSEVEIDVQVFALEDK